MFSSFAGVYFAVKSKSTVKCLLLTRKMLSKIRKTVYEKFFRKPFSKMLQPLTLPPLPSLSLFLAQHHSPPPSPHVHHRRIKQDRSSPGSPGRIGQRAHLNPSPVHFQAGGSEAGDPSLHRDRRGGVHSGRERLRRRIKGY